MSSWSRRVPAEESDALLRSVLVGLPGTAAAMYTLMTVGPEAREPLFRHVSEGAAEIDRARGALMAAVKDLPQPQRASSILVAQTVSLLASMMVATSRVAAQGRPDALPSVCHESARAIVELADRAVLTVPRQRVGSHGPPGLRPAATVDNEQLLVLLGAVSDQLDHLLSALTSRQDVPVKAASSRR